MSVCLSMFVLDPKFINVDYTQMVEGFPSSYKLSRDIMKYLNLKGHQNFMIGSKVTASGFVHN